MNTSLFTIVSVAAVVAIVAVSVALVVFVRRRTARAVEADQATWSALRTSSTGEGVEGEQAVASPAAEAADPSEELLLPLPTGDWQPPAEPAPAAHLPAVSLAERARGFDRPIPEVAPAATLSLEQVSPGQGELSGAPALSTAHVSTPPFRRVAAPQSPLEALVPQPVLAPTTTELEDELFSDSAFGSSPGAEPLWAPLLAAPEPPVGPSASSFAETTGSAVSAERPHAHARPLPDVAASSITPDKLVWPDEPASPPVRPGEFVAMVAPVEMWFGDYRVGVKAGSKTHAQFRKYADAMLDDLRGDSRRAR